jgi:hypothetical protein
MKTSSVAKYPQLVRALRPSSEEVEHYARIILKHEHRPKSALPACQREAELQLWAMRSLQKTRRALAALNPPGWVGT